jgi:methyl-accepting chemotaxis protein
MSKTNKNRKLKGKNIKLKDKKLLKKMINNDLELGDDIFTEEVSSIIDDANLIAGKNIQILIGGDDNKNLTFPTKLDELFGYNEPIDKRSIFEKMSGYVESVAMSKISSAVGVEGKNSKEITKKLEDDSKALEEVNNFFNKPESEHTKEELKEIAHTATEIVGEAMEVIPDKIKGSVNKVVENGIDAGIAAMNGLPIVGTAISLDKVADKFINTAGEIADATSDVSNLIRETSNKLKQPVNEMKEKINEISSDIQQSKEQLQQPVNEMKKKINEISSDIQQSKEQLQQSEQILNKNIQLGGTDISKFNNLLQHGGKKLRKRINNTRHAFKNISKNVTKKNK